MKKKSILIFTTAFVLIALFSVDVLFAQCSMCKAVLESEAKTGGSNVAGGLNNGILYLMSVPYLMVGGAGIWFYKKYKKNKSAEADMA